MTYELEVDFPRIAVEPERIGPIGKFYEYINYSSDPLLVI